MTKVTEIKTEKDKGRGQRDRDKDRDDQELRARGRRALNRKFRPPHSPNAARKSGIGGAAESVPPAGLTVLGSRSMQRSVGSEPGEGQRRWGRVLERVSCEERPRELSPQKRRLRGGLIALHKSLTGGAARCESGSTPRQPAVAHEDIVLSCAGGGKSSLTIQFVEGQFVDSYDPTIENTFTKLITVNGQEYHLQLVDTAGQDEYSIFPQTYSIDINGYILVYSVTSIKSFEVIKVIHGKLLDMVGKVQIPIMLVGNKKDLHMERVISYEEGKALAESWNAAFLESSAKENQTAVDVFKRIILEAEKIDGAASQGKSSCSVM
ncbi:GTP-binding protein Rheb [Geospiza fortis]|uniref:GTP-binding protein Rheb n=1 Tax=Geospiza fortis TaxID=48883 RepID=A0A6I9Z6U6_GEOFO|nr:GTP-binding protein Rheb [Geospiza fortis]